ncbi:MAG: UbiD family decarboxylase [Candidatus Tectomicrobia bacterium]|nr:UbiD family decarboxylase [Candidatus Tectomicrobia bacterium]
MSCLEEEEDLLRIPTPVDVKHQIAAYVRKTSDEQGPAILFERVKGYDMPVVSGLFATRRRVLRALEYAPEEAVERFYAGISNPIPPVRVGDGPCQEVVLEGEEADLTRLPIPTFSLRDGGAFITLGLSVTKDPDTGAKNAAIYRMQLKGRNRLGILSNSHQDCGHAILKAEREGKALEIAVAIGVDPVILVATQVKTRYGVDELSLAGGLRGKPVKVVKCRTVDLEVPATSEIVIEGRFLPNYREMEGPFGEFTGYDGPAGMRPVLEVTAITHRRSPIYHAALVGMPMTEAHFLKQLANEVTVFRELKSKFPEVKAVHFPASGCSEFTCYVSMAPRYKGQSRNVILAALGSAKRPKLVIVVDEDIDIYDDIQVLWAISTRIQADRDVIIVPAVGSAPLDPSTPEPNLSAVMGIDATRPFGTPFADVTVVPGVEEVPNLWELLRNHRAVTI